MWNILSAETLKYRRTAYLPIVILMPVVAVALRFMFFKRIEFFFRNEGQWTAETFLQFVRVSWGAFFFPVMVAILVAFVTYVDNKNNNWKLLLAQPLRRESIYLSKLIVLFVSAMVSSLILLISVLIAASLLKLNTPISLQDAAWLLLVTPTTLPVFAILLWLGTHIRSFFVPVGVGIAGHLVSIVGGGTSIGKFFPWTFPLEALQVGGIGRHISWLLFALSILMGIVITVAGCRSFVRRDVP